MPYSDSFHKALQFTLKWEGGYSNHPHDSGGPTMKGITQYTYDNYLKSKHIPNKPVKTITDNEVEDIYHCNYWVLAKCDTLPHKLSISVFDFAVNSGVKRALECLKLSNNDLELYLDNRERFFKAIGTGKNQVFLKGWLNRLNALRAYLKTLI